MSQRDSNLDRPADEEFTPHITSVAVSRYSGPLPPPEISARFEELYPGSAKLIIDDFLSESVQRREVERKVLPHVLFRQTLGSISASLLGLLGLGGGVWLSHEGRPLDGLSSIFGTLATQLAIFLYQSKKSE